MLAKAQTSSKAGTEAQFHDCEICRQGIQRKNEPILTCRTCHVWFRRACQGVNLSNHYYKAYKVNGNWNCPACRKNFPKDYCPCLQDKAGLSICAGCEKSFHKTCEGNYYELGTIIKGVWHCAACVKEFSCELQLSRHKGIKMVHLNIASIYRKYNLVRNFLSSKGNNIDIFAISESKLLDSDPDTKFDCDGYQMLRYDKPAPYSTRGRHDKASCGLVLYVHESYAIESSATIKETKDNIQFIALKLQKRKLDFCLVLIYSPQPNNRKFVDVISEVETRAKLISKNIFILGDINIDMNSEMKVAKDLKSWISENEFELQIKEPTRITERSSTLIDVVITNCKSGIAQSGTLNPNWSDHNMVYCVWNPGKPEKQELVAGRVKVKLPAAKHSSSSLIKD